jgi:hypothetical protein
MEYKPDDLDCLYDKLQWENPPANFTGRVLAQTQRTRRVQRVSTSATLLALTLLGVFGYGLGRGLAFSGTLDFLSALMVNLDLFIDAADDIWQALLDIVPWLELTAVLLSVFGIWLATTALPRLLNRSLGSR